VDGCGTGSGLSSPATCRARTVIVQRQVETLPVIDDEDHVVGIVTRGDLIAVLHRALLSD